MKLITDCPNCHSEIKIKSLASTRPDLSKEQGDEFKVTCKKCLKLQLVHVDKVEAKSSRMMVYGGVLISAVVTAVLWKSLGAIGTISIGIPVLIANQESTSASQFNPYKIDG